MYTMYAHNVSRIKSSIYFCNCVKRLHPLPKCVLLAHGTTIKSNFEPARSERPALGTFKFA